MEKKKGKWSIRKPIDLMTTLQNKERTQKKDNTFRRVKGSEKSVIEHDYFH